MDSTSNVKEECQYACMSGLCCHWAQQLNCATPRIYAISNYVHNEQLRGVLGKRMSSEIPEVISKVHSELDEEIIQCRLGCLVAVVVSC